MGDVVGLVVPMPIEMRPIVSKLSLQRSVIDGVEVRKGRLGTVDVVAVLCGIGTTRATERTRWMLEHVRPDSVIVAGVAGALGADLGIADVVVPAVVLDHDSGKEFVPAPLGGRPTSGSLLTSGELLDWTRLEPYARDGVTAVDMETSAVAAECEHRDVPWSVIRTISDRVSDGTVDASTAALARADGSADVPAALRFMLRRPWMVPRLMRMGRDTQRATRNLADAVSAALGS